MKNSLTRKKFRLNPVFVFLFFLGVIFHSCKDTFLEDNTPSWLGSSIYNQLNEGYIDDNAKKHTFENTIRLIDDVGYSDVLRKTGSKTVFVADDDAFDHFFQANAWNVSSYDQLTIAQKRIILNSCMINNALLIENLSTITGPVQGQALRTSTAMSVLDSIPFELAENLPVNNSYWDKFRLKGLRLAKDNTPVPLLHFLEGQMSAHHITSNDFSILFNGLTRDVDDAYIYNVKVNQRDITCKNGYIHILDEVLLPPSNMADVIHSASETKTFSSFLERFSAPYYSASLTDQFQLIGGTDSVFVKGYFSERSAIVKYNKDTKVCLDPDNKAVSSLLLFDPGWNLYRSSDINGSFQNDMGVIFAPSDDAMNNYFTLGAGRALIDRYGSKEAIPNIVLDKLVRNHMKTSFLASIPSQFSNIVDDAQEKMGITTSQIDKVYLSSNGIVYVTNTVYPPALYSSVMFPAYINENMKVFNWAIDQLEFDAYLLSMVNTYSFIIPTDNFRYIVPTSLKYNDPVAWEFHYDNVKKSVYASVHPYNVNTNGIGDSISAVYNASILKNHLEDMLDYHIIVGKIEGDRAFYRTKGGGTIKVTQNNEGDLFLSGGGDLERNDPQFVTKVYDQSKETNLRGNGKTYVLEQPVQTPTRSVYSILSDSTNYPQFYEFFKLLQGADDLWEGDKIRSVKYSVFYKDATQAGLDFNVRFLNTYHYTLYVPENSQVLEAINNGLPTWDDVAAETDQDIRDVKADQIIRFLRYHFQDNAVFLDKPSISASYQTATLNRNTDTFYKLSLSGGNNSLNINSGSGDVVSVVKTNGLYNMMARDFKFNTANPSNATLIETSSYVVIHQINKCLYFEGEFDLLSRNKAVKRLIRKY